MFYEKMKYYRKKAGYTQESLAQELHVFRQSITKWEQGPMLPDITILIAMSSLFHTSIDALVKEDVCQSIETSKPQASTLADFLVRAKKETYAAKKGAVEASRMDAHDYAYEEGAYRYLDSFVGSSMFSGEEIVYEQERAIWSMNYYGRVVNDAFQGDILKEALLQVSVEAPYRGPACVCMGEYVYHNAYTGSLEYFHGTEEIFYQGILIYEALYHGGTLK